MSNAEKVLEEEPEHSLTKKRAEKAYFHPTVRLFNAERLYYILVQSLEPVPEDRNALSGWLRETHLLTTDVSSITMDVIFGEADILIRVWADAIKLDAFLAKLNDQGRHRFRIRSLLLVNDMDICYQRRMENPDTPKMPLWNWNALTDWLDKLRKTHKKSACLPEDLCLRFPTNARKPRSSKHLVRFWVFCEGYSGNQWQFFEHLRRYVLEGEFPKLYGVEDPGAPDPDDRSEQGRQQLSEISFYSYEEVQSSPSQNNVPYAKQTTVLPLQGSILSKGVIIKAEFEIEPAQSEKTSSSAYQALMENLSFFIHEIRSRFGISTVTYLCARHLLSEHGFRPSVFNEVTERRKELLYSILKTPASARTENHAQTRANGGHAEALYARNERIQTFVTDMVDECYMALRVYHPSWWQTVSHVREVFGWLANGNNDALMGTMAREYPLIEKRLRDLLDRLGENNRWLARQEEELKHKLAPLENKLPEPLPKQKALYQKVRQLFRPEKHVTYRGIEEILKDIIAKQKLKGSLSVEKVLRLSMLTEAVEKSRDERNLLLHGEIANVLDEEFPDTEIPRKLWHTIVIHYLKLKLSLPLGEAVLEELIALEIDAESAKKD